MYQFQLQRHAALHVVLRLISNGEIFQWNTRERHHLTILLHYRIWCPQELPFVFVFFHFFLLTFLLPKPLTLCSILWSIPFLCFYCSPTLTSARRLYQWEGDFPSVNCFLFQLWVGKSEWCIRGIVGAPLTQLGLKSPLHKRGRRMAPGVVANCRLNWNRIIHNLLVCQVQWEVKTKVKRRERERKWEEKKKKVN